MTDVDTFLAHYGVKGMRWGVTREKTPRASRRERLEAAYRTKMSDVEAKTKADARIRTEKTLLIAGGIAVAAAASIVIGKKLHTEFAPINLPKGSSLQNVNQHGTDFDLDRITFATFKPKDNALYRDKFSMELLRSVGRKSNDVYATELKAVKDIKIPSKATARKLFKEYEALNGIVPKTKSTVTINGVRKTVRSNVTARMIANNRTRQISDPKKSAFLEYVASKGYDGIQDVMDQRRGSYAAKAPLMFVNGAHAMIIKGAEALDSSAIFERLRNETY